MHHWGTCWGSAPQSVFVLAPTCPAVNRRPATRPRAAARRCSAWSAPSAAARPRPRRSSRCTPAAAAPRCWPSSASAAGAAGRAPTCPATSALALLRSPRASPAWRPAWLAEGPARGRAPPGAVRGWQPRRAGGVMSRAGRAAHTGSLAPSALLGARPPGTRPSRPVGSRGCVRQLPGCLLVRSAQPTWALVAQADAPEPPLEPAGVSSCAQPAVQACGDAGERPAPAPASRCVWLSPSGRLSWR